MWIPFPLNLFIKDLEQKPTFSDADVTRLLPSTLTMDSKSGKLRKIVDIFTFQPSASAYERVKWVFFANEHGFRSVEGSFAAQMVVQATTVGMLIDAIRELRKQQYHGQARSVRQRVRAISKGGFRGFLRFGGYSSVFLFGSAALFAAKNSAHGLDLIECAAGTFGIFGAVQFRGIQGAVMGSFFGILMGCTIAGCMSFAFHRKHGRSIDDQYQIMRQEHWEACLEEYLKMRAKKDPVYEQERRKAAEAQRATKARSVPPISA